VLKGPRAFLLLAGFVFVYIALRAILVPLTHDEARTFFVYTLSGEFLPGLSHWDAGNHFLCTALGWVSYKAFGMAPIALRLASVLAFAVYAWYTWRMGSWMRDTLMRWSLWAALLLAPVLIEFFALYRGYGLGIALLLMALYHTAEAVRTASIAQVVVALLGWMLAASAMLTLVVVWCGGLLLLLLVVLRRPMSTGQRIASGSLWVLLGAVPAAAAVLLGQAMEERGLLYYGTRDGLIQGSLRSLGTMLFGPDAGWSVVPLTAALVAVLLYVAVLVLRAPRDMRVRPVTVIALLLAVELLGRLVLGEAFGVRYPEDRTALHWVPLLTLLTALVVDLAAERRAVLRWTGLVLLVLPLRTLATLNLSHTAIWPQEAISGHIFDTAARMQMAAGRPLLIDAYRQMPPQWDFERLRHYPGLAPLSTTGFPQGDCDLLLIDTTYFHAPPGFRTISTSASGRQVLKVRERPLQFALLKDSVLPSREVEGEFVTLLEPTVTELLGTQPVIDLALVLRSPERTPAIDLVIEVNGPGGEHLHYDLLELNTLQRSWQGDTLHLYRRIPTLAGNTRRVACYLWNRHRQEVELAYARARVLRIQPDHDLRDH
jgi:hypothetical protein